VNVRPRLTVAALLLLACGGAPAVLDAGAPSPLDAGPVVTDAGQGGSADSGQPPLDAGGPVAVDAGASDAGAPADAGLTTLDAGYVRGSLTGCWSDVRCQRVFSIAHGGSWNATSLPYDSTGALNASIADGTDGVKIDVRVTKDNVPVISHSSPLQFYESVDCVGQKIEDMTVAQVTACHRFPSTTEKFQRLDDVLNLLRGKLVAQLTVKLSTDYARTIAEVHAQHAEDFAFLEISAAELTTQIPTIPGAGTVKYVINAASTLTDVDVVLAANNPNAFIVEFDPPVQLGTIVTARLHPAGIRSFTYTNAATPTVADLKALFDKGFDIVSSQAGANGVAARQQVNQARGVTPP
jgi:glycerophosphoryl diester phosphodiesterase